MFFKKKGKFGFESLGKVTPARIKGDVATSKLLKYKFTLPNGFIFDDLKKFNQTDYAITEFSALGPDGTRIGVLISLTDEKDVKDLMCTWDKSKDKIQFSIFNRVFENFNASYVEQTEFLGLPCAHYSGVLKNNFKDGNKYYAEKYLFLAPYCMVDFNLHCREELQTQTYGLFRNFEVI